MIVRLVSSLWHVVDPVAGLLELLVRFEGEVEVDLVTFEQFESMQVGQTSHKSTC